MRAYSTLLLTILLLAHGSLAEAQFSAQLQGAVRDQTGGVLPGASVTLANVETGVSLTTVSDANGGFRFPNLAPGAYQVKVAMAGFKTATVDAQVLTQQTANVAVALDVASATEEVSVIGCLADHRRGRLARPRHLPRGGAPRPAVPGPELSGADGDRARRDRTRRGRRWGAG